GVLKAAYDLLLPLLILPRILYGVPVRETWAQEEAPMDELAELRTLLETGRIEEALLLVDELDEMSREDKINKMSSYMRILLIHLIKWQAEQRCTRSWEVSIK